MTLNPHGLRQFDLDKLAPAAPSVLLWEHGPSMLNCTERALFEQGHFNIERVNTFNQLLEAALRSSHPLTGQSRFEMILLDESLLECEGVQVLMILKSMPETMNVPILVVGNNPDSERYSFWMKAGAQGFMTR